MSHKWYQWSRKVSPPGIYMEFFAIGGLSRPHMAATGGTLLPQDQTFVHVMRLAKACMCTVLDKISCSNFFISLAYDHCIRNTF